MKKTVSLFLSLLIGIGLSFAKERSFVRIGIRDGLPNDYVLDVHQDRDGFMWFGTMTGLVRYDGYKFREAADAKTGKVFCRRVQRIVEDGAGNFWLSVFGGEVCKFDKRKNQVVSNYPEDLGYKLSSARTLLKLDGDGHAVIAMDKVGVLHDGPAGIRLFPFEDIRGISPKFIPNQMLQSSNGLWWICTTSGVLCLDIASGEYTRAIEDRHVIHAENFNGTMFFMTRDKVYAVDEESPGTGTVFFDASRSFGVISDMKLSPDGILWLYSASHGFYGIDIAEGDTTEIPGQKFAGHVEKFFIDKTGDLWFATSDASALYRYDVSSMEMHAYPMDLSRSYAQNRRVIYYMYSDTYGSLWIGTFADGMVEYEYATGELSVHRTRLNDVKSISSNGQLSIFEDSSGFLWIGTRKGGISKLNLNQKPFHSLVPDIDSYDPYRNEVNGLIMDELGRLVIPTYGNGIYIADPDGKKYKAKVYLDGKEFDASSLWLYNVFQDSSGDYWIATKVNGLYKAEIRPCSGGYEVRMETVSSDVSKNGGILDIYSFLEDRNGNLLIGSYGNGLLILDKNTMMLRSLDSDLPRNRRITYIRDLFRDSSGRLWVCGLGGISCLEYNDGKVSLVYGFSHAASGGLFLPFNDVNTVYEDTYGNFWFGTNGGGLYCWNEETMQTLSFMEENGLPSRVVYGIIEDGADNLWIALDKGLSRFSMTDQRFTTYLEDDGLLCSSFSECRPFRVRDDLYFGTTHGIVWFCPDSLDVIEYKPSVLLTDFRISNRSVVPGGKDGVLPEDVNYVDKVVLKHNQKDFSIEFSSDVYDNTEKHQYEYMLEGYDSEWLTASNLNVAAYSNIPSGRYVFKVRLTDDYGTLSAPEKELKIRVKRHVLASVPAIFVYVLIFIFAVFIIYRNRRDYFRVKSSLELEKRMTEFKIRFFTNISHELRTMITLIKAPLSRLSSMAGENSDMRSLTDIMTRNTNLLINLVNEILDFRKIQNNKMTMKVSSTQIISFFNVITDLFRISALNKNIEYKVSVAGEEKEGWFDVEKVEKIMTNLLSNALKFTKEGGRIDVSLRVNPDNMQISVADTGVGFNVSDPHLFERYHRGAESYYLQGTGIGLALVKEFVDLHRGTLNYDSKVGVGSKFLVTIPIRKDNYTEDEISATDMWSVGSSASDIFESSMYTDSCRREVNENGDYILVVEDNRELRNFLVDNLSDTYRVKGASNGREAWEMIMHETPDLVISDVVVPEMDGIELLRKVRHTDDINHLLFIILSAQATIEDKINGIGTGADDYIEKPFDFNYLRLRLTTLMNQRKHLLEIFRRKAVDSTGPIPGLDSNEESYLMKIDDIIMSHLDDQNFGVDELCLEMKQGKASVMKRLKLMTGCSLNQYIKLVRLKAAAEMLVERDYTVFEACYAVGYNDVNHFRIQFKNLFNKTPSQYKNDARKDSGEETGGTGL